MMKNRLEKTGAVPKWEVGGTYFAQKNKPNR
jgi:hypothetical protein